MNKYVINIGTFLKTRKGYHFDSDSCLYITNAICDECFPRIAGIDLLTHIYYPHELIYPHQIEEDIITDPVELKYWNTLYKLYLLKES